MSEGSQDELPAGGQEGRFPDHLLPGELLETEDPSAIERWIEVYAQLLSAKRAVLSTLVQRLRRVRPEVREELERRDLQLLGEEARRVENRLNFWLDKRRQG
jgi:hypothetical protein